MDDIGALLLVRRCQNGFRVGLIYADGIVSASLMLAAAMAVSSTTALGQDMLPGESMNSQAGKRRVEDATLTAEVWSGNPEALEVFEHLGWSSVGIQYHRMWLRGDATPQFNRSGAAQRNVFAVVDTAIGYLKRLLMVVRTWQISSFSPGRSPRSSSRRPCRQPLQLATV